MGKSPDGLIVFSFQYCKYVKIIELKCLSKTNVAIRDVVLPAVQSTLTEVIFCVLTNVNVNLPEQHLVVPLSR